MVGHDAKPGLSSSGAGVFHIRDVVTIDAPLPLVYAVVSDFTRYPEFINDVPTARIEGDTCIMTLRVGPMKIPLKTRVERVPLKLIQFTLIEGPIKSLVGRWAFEGDEATTTLTVSAQVEAGALGPWMTRMVGRVADRHIRRVEAAFRDRVAALMRNTVDAGGNRDP